MIKETRILMGMPITAKIADPGAGVREIDTVFDYFEYVDRTFSTYKPESEISRFNRGEISENDLSSDMREVLRLSDDTKAVTRDFFDITKPDGALDPSGLVKGWAIRNAAEQLRAQNFRNFYIDAGGDIELCGYTAEGTRWSVGIRDPFSAPEIRIVKTIFGPHDPHGREAGMGVATSGTYVRGNHIYDPHTNETAPRGIVSMTVIGPNVYDADRFATAAFAMGRAGIDFIESLQGFEGYMIDEKGIATETSGFGELTK